MVVPLVVGVGSLLLIHFLADFVCQSDWMALNKSKRMDALLLHTIVYSAFFLGLGWKFAAVTFLCHTVQDYITSRVNAYLWQREMRHWFFVSIGLDQWLHYMQLLLCLAYIK